MLRCDELQPIDGCACENHKQNDKPRLVVLFVVALLVNLLRAYTTLVKNDGVGQRLCAISRTALTSGVRSATNAANAHGVGCPDFTHVGAIGDDRGVTLFEHALFD